MREETSEFYCCTSSFVETLPPNGVCSTMRSEPITPSTSRHQMSPKLPSSPLHSFSFDVFSFSVTKIRFRALSFQSSRGLRPRCLSDTSERCASPSPRATALHQPGVHVRWVAEPALWPLLGACAHPKGSRISCGESAGRSHPRRPTYPICPHTRLRSKTILFEQQTDSYFGLRINVCLFSHSATKSIER